MPTDALGDFVFSINATYLEKLNIQKSALPGLTDDKGLFNTDTGGSSPDWVTNFALSWVGGNWDASYRFIYNSETLRAPLINNQRSTASTIIDDPYVDSFINHDLQAAYTFRDSYRVYLGIRNLTDESPDKVQGSLNGASGRQGFAGRSYYVGFNGSFSGMWN